MSYLEMAKRVKVSAKEAIKAKKAPVVEDAAFANVTDIKAARVTQRDPDERRLIAAGWTPKDGCGPLNLTIWQHPESGFYSSRGAALRRLENPLPPGRRTGNTA